MVVAGAGGVLVDHAGRCGRTGQVRGLGGWVREAWVFVVLGDARVNEDAGQLGQDVRVLSHERVTVPVREVAEPGVDALDLIGAEGAQGEVDRRCGDDLLHGLILHLRRSTASLNWATHREGARVRPLNRATAVARRGSAVRVEVIPRAPNYLGWEWLLTAWPLASRQCGS